MWTVTVKLLSTVCVKVVVRMVVIVEAAGGGGGAGSGGAGERRSRLRRWLRWRRGLMRVRRVEGAGEGEGMGVGGVGEGVRGLRKGSGSFIFFWSDGGVVVEGGGWGRWCSVYL